MADTLASRSIPGDRACATSVVLPAFVLVLAGCGSGAVGGPLDAFEGSVTIDGTDSATTDVFGTADVSPDPVQTDRPMEAESPEDTLDAEDLPRKKSFLEPCQDNTECESGFCVTHAGADVCTEVCLQTCPAGWTCRQVTGVGPDVTYLCVSDFWALCRPCKANADCEGDGGAVEACVRYGEDGYFCGAACKTGDDCPEGYECAEVTSASGGVTRQCVAKTRECACTARYVKLGLKTQCAKVNDWGTCWGERACTDAGLTACDSAAASAEVCNGKDDDCDGQKDEDLPDCCVCGNHVAETFCGESVANCPVDFAACGDGSCVPGEGPVECPEDCCGSCGDGTCRGFSCGEDVKTCPQDCGAVCGNGKCEYGEGPASCVQDCKWDVCGNQVCEPGDGGPTGCPADCGNACGDCTCDPDEDWQTCPIDCGYCGDGLCSPCANLGEEATYCPKDCGLDAEVCDGLDNDHDGETDEADASGCVTFFLDGDGDGYGWGEDSRCLCGPEGKYTSGNGSDCDDTDPETHPAGTEVCDGQDNDCNGFVDDPGAEGCQAFWQDQDQDGQGASDAQPLCLCQPDPVTNFTATVAGDCDDTDATIHAGADETCNNRDDDCNGGTDEPWPDKGNPCDGPDPDECAAGTLECSPGGHSVECVGDVPGTETCNGWDDDCDGAIDEDLGSTTCGVGACAHVEPNCLDGKARECDPLAGAQAVDDPDVTAGGFVDADCDGVDGEASRAVFVDGKAGKDTAPGTRDKPLKTVGKGLAIAVAEGKAYVLVSKSTYSETVSLAPGIGLFGLYDRATGWSRDPGNLTVLSGGEKGLVAEHLDQATWVHGFTIRSAWAKAPGASSYGVFASDSPGLRLAGCVIEAGSGAAGAKGAAGTQGKAGNAGGKGGAGISGTAQVAGGSGGSGCALGGAGGGCCQPGMCPPYGATGIDGTAGPGPLGGFGGKGGCFLGGSYGGTGAWGAMGSEGSAGGELGSVTPVDYQPAAGLAGGPGGPGGGGGGGGGGGTSPTDGKIKGSGGGGGGGAGCGGSGGMGGGGGGASVAVFVASGFVVVLGSELGTGSGGTGGAGGSGGQGGAGGTAGKPGTPYSSMGMLGLSGAPGGLGGPGGQGGAGGGGGGGPVLGVLCAPGAGAVTSGVSYYALGEPGQGGSSPGNVGATGLKAEVHGCIVPSEACNGLDDDWDGETDEDLGSTTCGTGECTVTEPNCLDGAPHACTPGAPVDESCNNKDDDCDGKTDEDFGTTTCGTGACAVTVPNCQAGEKPPCTPKAPGPETCNGLDDDCDGTTDEDPEPCPGGGPCKDGHCGCFPACGAGKVCEAGTCRACSTWVKTTTCWPYSPNHATFQWAAPSSPGPCKVVCTWSYTPGGAGTVLHNSTNCSGSVTLSWPLSTYLYCTIEAPEADGTCTAVSGCA